MQLKTNLKTCVQVQNTFPISSVDYHNGPGPLNAGVLELCPRHLLSSHRSMLFLDNFIHTKGFSPFSTHQNYILNVDLWNPDPYFQMPTTQYHLDIPTGMLKSAGPELNSSSSPRNLFPPLFYFFSKSTINKA